MSIIILKKYYIISVFFLSFIITKSLSKEENNIINNNKKDALNNNYKSFANQEGNKENSLTEYIKDHLIFVIIIGVAFIVLIVLIIIAIIFSIKINKKYRDLKIQINKVSFKNDSLRPSNNTIEDDDLLV